MRFSDLPTGVCEKSWSTASIVCPVTDAITVLGLWFSTRDQDTPAKAPTRGTPLSFYNTSRKRISPTRLAKQLHAETGFELDDRPKLDLRLGPSMLGAIEDSGAYLSNS